MSLFRSISRRSPGLRPAAPYPPAPPGPYPAPPGPPPAYGSPPPSGYPGGSRPGTDGVAIAAFVFSLLGGVLFSVVLGIVALTRIRRSGRRGRGLAVAALVVSGLWTLAVGALIVAAVTSSADRDSTGAVTKAGSIAAEDLRTGDCLRAVPPGDGGVTSVDVTPCTTAHRGEVYATFDLPDGSYPGTTQVRQLAAQGCQDRAPDLAAAPADLGGLYLYPELAQWRSGDRSVTCLVVASTDLQSPVVPR